MRHFVSVANTRCHIHCRHPVAAAYSTPPFFGVTSVISIFENICVAVFSRQIHQCEVVFRWSMARLPSPLAGGPGYSNCSQAAASRNRLGALDCITRLNARANTLPPQGRRPAEIKNTPLRTSVMRVLQTEPKRFYSRRDGARLDGHCAFRSLQVR